MKKYIITFLIFFSLLSPVFASEISMYTNKTDYTTDDIIQIHISINGQVDNGQIGITGLENFEIVGQQSSQKIQTINGKTTSTREQILSLKAKNTGKLTIIAIGKENGEEIQSKPIILNIKKSLVQSTKENLLKNTTDSNDEDEYNTEINDDTDNNINTDNTKNNLINSNTNQQNLLGLNPNTQQNFKQLQKQENPNFPAIKHISAFNTTFWLNITKILSLIIILFASSLWLIKHYKIK